jgi:hypothetical protein
MVYRNASSEQHAKIILDRHWPATFMDAMSEYTEQKYGPRLVYIISKNMTSAEKRRVD